MVNNLAIMYSGGLDSLIMYNYAKAQGIYDNITCVHVQFGQQYSQKEHDSISRIGPWYPKVEVINIDGLMPLIARRLTNQIIPSRNVLLSVIGSMIADTVWLGILDGEQLGKEHDKSDQFIRDTQALLSFTNEFFQKRTLVQAPFRNLSKSDTIAWALAYGIPLDVLYSTTSCYHPTELKCGECLTCVKRAMAFATNKIIEPGYEKNPFESNYLKELDQEITLAASNGDRTRFTDNRIMDFFKFKNAYQMMGVAAPLSNVSSL